MKNTAINSLTPDLCALQVELHSRTETRTGWLDANGQVSEQVTAFDEGSTEVQQAVISATAAYDWQYHVTATEVPWAKVREVALAMKGGQNA